MSSNALEIFGGGITDSAKDILMYLGKNIYLSNKFKKVYLGKYSFESFFNPDYLMEYNEELEKLVSDKRGTYFGTCRDIDLNADKHLMNRSIFCLKQNNIDTIFVVGGDGTARQVAEINEVLNANGIKIIYVVPMTIDGINGGESIGLAQATRESIRQVENIVSTSLETKDNGKFGVVIVELQGRNRDDIMAEVILNFVKNGKIADNKIDDILFRVIPANIEFDIDKLVDEVNNSSKKTLILVSEGAIKKFPEVAGFSKRITRKVRELVVGYSSQSNNMTTDEDRIEYKAWVDTASNYILSNLDHSYCMVKRKDLIFEAPIDYYLIHNPKDGQTPEMDACSKYWITKFIAK
jgi:6-phosphofructokinase